MKAFNCTKQTVKHLTCALLCTLAMTAVGCSKEEPNAPEGNKRRITATANIVEDAPDTRVNHDQNGAMSWDTDDQFNVWKAGETTLNLFSKTGGSSQNGEFEGEVDCNDGDQLYAVYPASRMSLVAADKMTLDLSSQTGEYKDVDKPHYMYAMATQSGNKADFNFQHAVAILEIRLPDGPRHMYPFTLSAKGLHTQATLEMTPTGATVTGTKEGNIVVDYLYSNLVVLYLFPGRLTDITLQVEDVGYKFIATLPEKELVAGKVYQANVRFEQVQ